MNNSSAFYVLLIINIYVSSCLGGSNTLRCYYCDDSQTSACGDPAVTALLTSVECKEPPSLVIPRNGESITDLMLSHAENGQFSGIAIISDILLREASRNTELNNDDYTFYCGKLILVSGENKSLQRRCIPVKKDVSNVCDFIIEELDDRIQVESCHLCDTDQCNSSTMIVSSIFILFFTFISIRLIL